jgi:hypothetical protein
MGKMNKLARYLDSVCILFKDFEPMQGEDPAPTAEFVSYRIEDGKTIITRFCSLCEMNEDDVIKQTGTDFIYIGDCPHEENPHRTFTSGRICNALILQFRNTHGKEPDGARLFAKHEPGADGYTVCCEYTNEKPYSVAYAFMLEDNLPKQWSPAAKRFLEGGKHENET